jgi:nitroreductase
MAVQAMTVDEALSTTRAVRRRLDLARPVAREVLEECLALAQQAPSGGNVQPGSFVVVTDAATRLALAELYRRVYEQWLVSPFGQVDRVPGQDPAAYARMRDSSDYLAAHLHEVPVHVIPVIRRRADNQPIPLQAGIWGAILPATWSFMLAARARGLGTVWTTIHLEYEEEAAALLGIPYAEVMQAALIPVAHTIGTDFRPGVRRSLDEFIRWERW